MLRPLSIEFEKKSECKPRANLFSTSFQSEQAKLKFSFFKVKGEAVLNLFESNLDGLLGGSGSTPFVTLRKN